MMAGGGGDPCDGLPTYTSTRFEYASNGQVVTFAHDESWCWDTEAACEVPGSYQVTWAREFRYDGARARYMNRQLNPSTLATIATTWSDYDGDEVHGDFTVSGTTVTNTDSYQPGLWRRIKVGTNFVPKYLHNDHLGTLRAATNAGGTSSGSDAFTAFGERVSGTADRFGYVGAWGYQSTIDSTTGAEVFPYSHVGARYYDPSSGRFLQRDPIGIEGGTNVYVYALNNPARHIDPEGEWIGLVRVGAKLIKPLARGAMWCGKQAAKGARWTRDKAKDAWRWLKNRIWQNEPSPKPQEPPIRVAPPDFDPDIEGPGPDDIDPYDPFDDSDILGAYDIPIRRTRSLSMVA